jgi:hypothetical protein
LASVFGPGSFLMDEKVFGVFIVCPSILLQAVAD